MEAADRKSVVIFNGGSLHDQRRDVHGEFAQRLVIPATFDGMRAIETYARSDTSEGFGQRTIVMTLEQLQVTEIAAVRDAQADAMAQGVLIGERAREHARAMSGHSFREDTHRELVAFIVGELARANSQECIAIRLISVPAGMAQVHPQDAIASWSRQDHPEVFDGRSGTEDLVTEILEIAEVCAGSLDGAWHRFWVLTEHRLGGQRRTEFRVPGTIVGASERPTTRIVRAAIRRGAAVYSVPRPGRHHDALALMSEYCVTDFRIDEQGLPSEGEFGFLTSEGEFVTRTVALGIANGANQVIKKTAPADRLFSEDVW